MYLPISKKIFIKKKLFSQCNSHYSLIILKVSSRARWLLEKDFSCSSHKFTKLKKNFCNGFIFKRRFIIYQRQFSSRVSILLYFICVSVIGTCIDSSTVRYWKENQYKTGKISHGVLDISARFLTSSNCRSESLVWFIPPPLLIFDVCVIYISSYTYVCEFSVAQHEQVRGHAHICMVQYRTFLGAQLRESISDR